MQSHKSNIDKLHMSFVYGNVKIQPRRNWRPLFPLRPPPPLPPWRHWGEGEIRLRGGCGGAVQAMRWGMLRRERGILEEAGAEGML
ncbi:uncharacterized protein VTP21DRAFT_1185 [Calcarisporiella thermophila]|uniref:uncharacterized protein n=1 Tax=Calcarisporiella thermophila TaxID=911321 RepID=UPI003742B7C7